MRHGISWLCIVALIVTANIAHADITHINKTQQIACMAMNIYFEARGESINAQVAVAQTVMNRVASSRWPNSICRVIFEGGERLYRCQFSWFCDGKSDSPKDLSAFTKAVLLSERVIAGKWRSDLSHGATCYHNKDVSPSWAKAFPRVAQLGRHIFYDCDRNSEPMHATK